MHLKNETFYVLIFLKKKSSSEERDRDTHTHRKWYLNTMPINEVFFNALFGLSQVSCPFSNPAVERLLPA